MGLLDTLGNLTGLSSGYDGEAAKKATQTANAINTNSTANYGAATGQLSSLAAQDAAQNYYGTAQDVYGQQQGAANMLLSAATGAVPSAAAIQQGVGQQAANAGLQSAALSQQGAMNPALAGRNMLNAQAQAQQGIVASGTAQRAQEQSDARNQYSAHLNTMQGQQQNQDQLIYQQGQNYLDQQNRYNTQNLQAIQNTARTNLGNNMGQITGQATADASQAAALGGTLSAASSAMTAGVNPTSLLSKVIPK